MLNNKGYSLVELIVVMGIFLGLMMIMTSAFENIIGRSGQQVKSAETQTEGIVGLEMLRADLEHLGYGLPWTIPAPTAAPGYPETTVNAVNGINSADFVDQTPRAVRVGFVPGGNKIIDESSNTNQGAAYLVLKSTRVALSTQGTEKKWTYVNYSSQAGTNVSYLKKWGTVADDLAGGERVITVYTTFASDGTPDKRLAMIDSSHYSYQIPDPAPAVVFAQAGYKPGDGSQLYVTYGVDPATNLRMPYNRADYYIKKDAGMPATCNPGTGILFKGVVKHLDGTFTEYPLLNCVGDMQVEFELDPGNDGNITYSATPPTTAGDVRSQLKTVRIYILAHEGKKDRNYSFAGTTIQVGDAARPSSSGRTWNGSPSCTGSNCMQTVFGSDWRNYRWKVYTIVGRPKNLS